MIADLVQPCPETVGCVGPDDLSDATILWAMFNVLDDLDVAPDYVPTVRSARRTFMCRLADQGVSQVDLFEHLADAIDREDWTGLGLPEVPD